MRLLCGVATGLFYGEKKDGGFFLAVWLCCWRRPVPSLRARCRSERRSRAAIPWVTRMGSRGGVARGRKFPEKFAEQPDSPELLLGPRHRKNHLSTFGDFTYQVGLRSRRRGYLIHSMLIPATLAGSLQGEPKTHNGQMPTQLNPKKVLLCKN